MTISFGNVVDLRFPKNDAHAESRFQKYRKHDPLSIVQPALLNAGDIYDYARITGMIWPFPTDEQTLKEKLKPASFEIDFLGTVHYVDERGDYQKVAICRQTPFTLKKNSIIFVSPACKFRLPSYIGLRFNLRITHVHRGLLLGTGPLIDPGFAGRLLIPLHNLTDKDYVLIGGEGLIWVEFTKLSPRRDNTRVVDFPETKWNLSAREYFNKASQGKPAVSSIPGEVAQAAEDAKRAQSNAERAERFSKTVLWGGVVALVALIVSLGSVLIGTWNLISTANKNINDIRGELNSKKSNEDLLKKIDCLKVELQTLRKSDGVTAQKGKNPK